MHIGHQCLCIMHYAKIHDPPVSQLGSLVDAMQYEIYAL